MTKSFNEVAKDCQLSLDNALAQLRANERPAFAKALEKFCNDYVIEAINKAVKT